jgi:hypothetical protein
MQKKLISKEARKISRQLRDLKKGKRDNWKLKD